MLAVAGVLGAISLAGIFIVYLVNTIGDNNNGQTTAAVATPSATGATGTSGTSGAAGVNGAAGSTPPATATPPAAAGKPGATSPAIPAATVPLNVIPNNQVFTTFTNRTRGYSILYPKGWTSKGADNDVQFTHNNDFERIVAVNAPVPSIQAVRNVLRVNKAVRLAKGRGNPGRTTINGAPVIRATLIGRTPIGKLPDGTPIRLVIDQYKFFHKGKAVTINMATPDRVRPRNAGDYRKIIQSFKWL
jgi:hypothetical protein